VIPLAHIAGIPVEELALTIAGAGVTLAVARAWVRMHLRGHGGGRA
jgi:hypothetical protein